VGLRNSRDKVVAAIKYALDDAGIEIPFLRRTLTFKDSRISQKIASRKRDDSGENMRWSSLTV
ncbi:MAG: hypothetical protein AAF802_18665, partial [Planctomycetota bacterium]